jgi:hypothetical protein
VNQDKLSRTWTLGREHCVIAESMRGKRASTSARLRDVGSARNRDAEKAALAMASSCAMAAGTKGSVWRAYGRTMNEAQNRRSAPEGGQGNELRELRSIERWHR